VTPIRAAGSFLGVFTGILAVIVEYTKSNPTCSSACVPGASTVWLAVAGAALAAASLVSWGGFRVTFYMGSVLAVMVFAADLALRGQFPADEWELTGALSLATVAVDMVASRPAKTLAEKDSPLNLPVFG
jgi:hypothetical protein